VGAQLLNSGVSISTSPATSTNKKIKTHTAEGKLFFIDKKLLPGRETLFPLSFYEYSL
jgi:hypothetical protein